jgi:recombination protein RecA
MPKRKSTKDVKQALTKKKSDASDTKPLLSTGSTLLNLACSGKVEGGFGPGHYILLVGDTNSGKTWLSLTCFAEASINEAYKEHRLIFDDAENGALMDMEKFFGKEAAERIESPGMEDGEPVFSETAEDFYFHVDDALKDGRPFIYVLDSIDSLTSIASEDKFEKNKKLHREGKDTTGSYGDGKAKINSENLRKIVGDLEKSDSILIIINQTRDNLDPMPFSPKKGRSGGWALEFYSHLVLWSSVGGQINRTVKGKKRQIGVISNVKVKRSRITGRQRGAELPIYHSFGIDDIGSCVDFLVSEGVWKKAKKGGMITVTGLGPEFKGRIDDVVCRIEEEGAEEDLKSLVVETWQDIEEACKVERKSRYS